ncbi:hypothetical protein SAMN05443549_10639 [Flavobacterium fluvii]|uniref:Uncharacterized protein n=1 Tax=Flavobacterium fluvii TaxID=468056 RepID=A0A1M5M4V0_9FLAO|nr:hypothetical protein SAMN05443549_10639 [Flavobacterium fluvii]
MSTLSQHHNIIIFQFNGDYFSSFYANIFMILNGIILNKFFSMATMDFLQMISIF